MLNLVLYQPDIPQNLGACLRLSACLGCRVHIIEPCGFPLDDAKLRRAGMDYIHKAEYVRHLNWQAFLEYRAEQDRGTRVAVGEPPRSGGGLGVIPPSETINYEGEPARNEYGLNSAVGGSGAMPPSETINYEGEPARNEYGLNSAGGGSGAMTPSRLLLLETDGSTCYSDFSYRPSDYVVLGSEGAGTPRSLYAQMDATLTIPMRAGLRSLNLAMSAGMLVAEACRQMGWKFL